MTRTCLDCGATLVSKSPRCPEHRAEHRRQSVRAIARRWLANPENRARQYASAQRRRRTKRLHALADQLGYILVPL